MIVSSIYYYAFASFQMEYLGVYCSMTRTDKSSAFCSLGVARFQFDVLVSRYRYNLTQGIITF